MAVPADKATTPERGAAEAATLPETHPSLTVIKRDNRPAAFESARIAMAIQKAFISQEGSLAETSRRVKEEVERLTRSVTERVAPRLANSALGVETIQDAVETVLMDAGHHQVARAYILYREQHAAAREHSGPGDAPEAPSVLNVTDVDGQATTLAVADLAEVARQCCDGIDGADPEALVSNTVKNLYDGVSLDELRQALILTAKSEVEREPNYTFVAARALLFKMVNETLSALLGPKPGGVYTLEDFAERYEDYFHAFIDRGIELELLDDELTKFDLSRLAGALEPERDYQFNYLGLQTLYDRYYIQHAGLRLELGQAFLMRVAMGLAINEPRARRDERAIEFYRMLSSFDFMSSTPTLFNSATRRPQLSSCYLSTVPDDLDGIFSAIKDDAMLSKFAGGLGNDWTPVRAMGAHIKGTNGKSQGVVPFLKVANDTAVSVNQGGKRRGAMCAYLETWHKDIEEFLDLRKNTGDERRRTHDMNTANWVPDLFVKRAMNDEPWTLFSPDDTPDLHELYGTDFERAYEAYEAAAARGDITNYKVVSAKGLWRKMLGLLFETGHPWFTFKDPCNLRSPQSHAGVVHSSNLCTEITLNTRAGEEIAVCNLGSVNLAQHVVEVNGAYQLDVLKLQRTVRTAMRMLDNVIDYNYYSVETARDANLRHRPVGLGMMGFQDALYKLGIAYDSDAAVDFADKSMELVSFYAIQASTELAAERGTYPSFEGSLWSRGVLPIDSIERLADARGEGYLEVNREIRMDWDSLRERVQTVGMRNSNCMAIAPTATIANITGVSQSIEPTFQNLFVKSNLSGEFTVINPYLVAELKARGLWDAVMVHDLKYFDGSVQPIDRIPAELKTLYKNAFEIDPNWLVEAASRRQKWIDQAQSLNLYMAEPSGPKLEALYQNAWLKGLKTTYYLRTVGATHTEKSTIDDSKLNQVPSQADSPMSGQACSIDDPECEACQ